MAWIRAMGAPAAAGLKIYDTGSWGIGYDNGVYSMGASFTVIGGITPSASSFDITSTGLGGNQCKSMVTAGIDLSQYSTLHVECNGIEQALDVSSLTTTGYLCVFCYNYSGLYSTRVILASQKTNFDSYSLGNIAIRTGAGTDTFTRIWLD